MPTRFDTASGSVLPDWAAPVDCHRGKQFPSVPPSCLVLGDNSSVGVRYHQNSGLYERCDVREILTPAMELLLYVVLNFIVQYIN